MLVVTRPGKASPLALQDEGREVRMNSDGFVAENATRRCSAPRKNVCVCSPVCVCDEENLNHGQFPHLQ